MWGSEPLSPAQTFAPMSQYGTMDAHNFSLGIGKIKITTTFLRPAKVIKTNK